MKISLCTVSMFWNGTNITTIPTFIYHDELTDSHSAFTDPFAPGHLVCRSATPLLMHWSRSADESRLSDQEFSLPFIHTRRGREIHRPPIYSRLSQNPDSPITISNPATESEWNGLWRCNEFDRPEILYVALYARVPGKPSYLRGRGFCEDSPPNVTLCFRLWCYNT